MRHKSERSVLLLYNYKVIKIDCRQLMISACTNYILRWIFDFSSSILKVYFHGQIIFRANDMTNYIGSVASLAVSYRSIVLFLTIIVDDLTLNRIIVVNLCSWWIKRKARWWGRRRDSTAAMCLHIRAAWQRCYGPVCMPTTGIVCGRRLVLFFNIFLEVWNLFKFNSSGFFNIFLLEVY